MMPRLPLALLVCAATLARVGVADADAPAATAPVQQQPAGSQQTAAAGGPQAASSPAPPADVQLSNERTLTTWAHPAATPPIHARPETGSRTVGQVHLETEDGFPEVYLLLASHTDPQGRVWVRMRIPGRPNGRTGWVPRSALGSFHKTRWLIVISLSKRRLSAYLDGHRRFIAPVGVGKPSTPTPAGRFWIRERFRLTNRGNPYWPYALGTSDYSTLSEWPGGGVVGIHGDFGEPQQIPGDPSHGCVRMRDRDIAWLAPRVTLGTPVDIR